MIILRPTSNLRAQPRKIIPKQVMSTFKIDRIRNPINDTSDNSRPSLFEQVATQTWFQANNCHDCKQLWQKSRKYYTSVRGIKSACYLCDPLHSSDVPHFAEAEGACCNSMGEGALRLWRALLSVEISAASSDHQTMWRWASEVKVWQICQSENGFTLCTYSSLSISLWCEWCVGPRCYSKGAASQHDNAHHSREVRHAQGRCSNELPGNPESLYSLIGPWHRV